MFVQSYSRSTIKYILTFILSKMLKISLNELKSIFQLICNSGTSKSVDILKRNLHEYVFSILSHKNSPSSSISSALFFTRNI